MHFTVPLEIPFAFIVLQLGSFHHLSRVSSISLLGRDIFNWKSSNNSIVRNNLIRPNCIFYPNFLMIGEFYYQKINLMHFTSILKKFVNFILYHFTHNIITLFSPIFFLFFWLILHPTFNCFLENFTSSFFYKKFWQILLSTFVLINK